MPEWQAIRCGQGQDQEDQEPPWQEQRPQRELHLHHQPKHRRRWVCWWSQWWCRNWNCQQDAPVARAFHPLILERRSLQPPRPHRRATVRVEGRLPAPPQPPPAPPFVRRRASLVHRRSPWAFDAAESACAPALPAWPATPRRPPGSLRVLPSSLAPRRCVRRCRGRSSPVRELQTTRRGP